MREHYHAIYLSPHLDDAVLSCGGQICQHVRAGRPVLVVTIAAGDPPTEGLSALAKELQAGWGLEKDPGARRRAEDVKACEVLGADHLHWKFQECIYRANPAGRPLYPSRRDLFRRVHPADDAEANEWAQWMSRLPAHDRVLAPLGSGNHVDHQLARRAAELCFGRDLLYYEDFPYAQKWTALLPVIARRAQWQAEVVPLDDAAVLAKCDAILAYESQAQMIFRSGADMDLQVRRYIRRVGGERLWKKRQD